MNININQHINLDGVIAVVIGKLMKYKDIKFESDKEIEDFIESLRNDEDYINAVKNMIILDK